MIPFSTKLLTGLSVLTLEFICITAFTNEEAAEKGENSETESLSPVKAKVDNPS